TLVWWPAAIVVRWNYGRKLELTSTDRWWRVCMRLVCIFDLAVVCGWLKYFDMLGEQRTDRSLDGFLTALQIAGWVGVAGTLVVILYALRSWRTPNRWLLGKLGDTGIAFGCISLVKFAWICNFLHISTKF
ncbi:MAG: hypothetical protein ACRD5L_01575, partial [Bryobacteraceae bacterium]